MATRKMWFSRQKRTSHTRDMNVSDSSDFFLFDALVQVKWSDDEKDECLTREEAEKVNVNDDEGGWG